jgi:lipopolysaccharide export system protein LptC
MKHWPGHLFPVILLGVLAALSFWLQTIVERGETPPAKIVRHEADTVVENFSARRLDENGQVKYRLIAPYMMHFADDDSSELKSPTLVAYRPDAPPVTVSGRNAKVSSKGEVVYLWDSVVVTREATPGRPALTGTMPDLTVLPDAGTAFTPSPVEITQGASWVKGVGMQIDNEASTFQLQSQVSGLYFRVREPR